MKLILKLVAALIFTSAVLLFVVMNFSATTTDLSCDGELTIGSNSTSETAYIEFSKYRWWVHLWNSSYGTVVAQTDKSELSKSAPYVATAGNGILAVHVFYDINPAYADRGYLYTPTVLGTYRESNREVTLRFSSNASFQGKCHPR